MTSSVVAVHRDRDHRFSKPHVDVVTLVAGFGVVGDAHAGKRVQHRSRVAVDPSQPNLRQVHLIHAELLDQLRAEGFDIEPGQLGENITTAGLDLLALPRGTRLRIGSTAVIEVTGLHNPCSQIEAFMPGLLKEVVHRCADGSLVRKTGIMGVVEADGDVLAGDVISGELPTQPHEPLDRVPYQRFALDIRYVTICRVSTLTIRTDPEVERALVALTREGVSRSEAARTAILEAERTHRRARLRAEAESLRDDPEDVVASRGLAAEMDALRAW